MSYRDTSLAIAALMLCSFTGKSQTPDGVLLNCDRYDGEEQFQIYINETAGYIIYNAQVRDGNYDREREYVVVGESSEEKVMIDDGLTIVVNNSAVIQAADESSSFLFVKQTARYAYASTTLAPIEDGVFLPIGNHHQGACSVNPFSQAR
jgi:hypothetical protein